MRRDGLFDPDYELTLRIGRRVMDTQADINRYPANQTRNRPDGTAERFTTRATNLDRIFEAAGPYRDLLPPAAAQRRVEAQQLEISHVLPRLPSVAHIDAAQLAHIENACQNVAVTVARAIRRQATRPNSPYVRIGERPGPVDYKATLPRTCKALIDQACPATRWSDPTARDALRDALRDTPTRPNPKRPPRRMNAGKLSPDIAR